MTRHLSQELCSNFSKLVDIASCLPASSAAAERVFSVQNRIKNKYRNRLSLDVPDQLMTARLLEAPKGFEAKAFEQWWSAKGIRVCNSRSGVKKIKSSIPSAIPEDNALYLNSDKSDDEDSIPEGDGDSVSEDGDSDSKIQTTNRQLT